MAYEASIGRAIAWGEMVKGAFDLYRWDLLRRLGYGLTPITAAEERRLWSLISQQMIFGDTRRVLPPAYAESGTYAMTNPQWLTISLAASVSTPDAVGKQRVHIHLKNDDRSKRGAKKVVVIHRLAATTELVHGSVLPGDVAIDGVNPVRFHVGALDPGSTADLSFETIRHKA